jgi:uncharacterized protein YjdB
VNLTVSTGPSLFSIAVTPSDPSVAIGGTEQFTATGTYGNNSTANLTTQVQWSSGNTSVATIVSGQNGGLATAVASGNSTITATLGTVSGSTNLNVAPVTLVSIAVTPASPSIANGQTEQFTATGTYNNGSTQNINTSVEWQSGNTNVARITNGQNGGLASTFGTGTAKISATLGSVSGSTNLTVTALGQCDINQDGIYDVPDAQLMINQALGAIPAANDLNGDHVVNVVDIQIVINAVLGLGCTV